MPSDWPASPLQAVPLVTGPASYPYTPEHVDGAAKDAARAGDNAVTCSGNYVSRNAEIKS